MVGDQESAVRREVQAERPPAHLGEGLGGAVRVDPPDRAVPVAGVERAVGVHHDVFRAVDGFVGELFDDGGLRDLVGDREPGSGPPRLGVETVDRCRSYQEKDPDAEDRYPDDRRAETSRVRPPRVPPVMPRRSRGARRRRRIAVSTSSAVRSTMQMGSKIIATVLDSAKTSGRDTVSVERDALRGDRADRDGHPHVGPERRPHERRAHQELVHPPVLQERQDYRVGVHHAVGLELRGVHEGEGGDRGQDAHRDERRADDDLTRGGRSLISHGSIMQSGLRIIKYAYFATRCG